MSWSRTPRAAQLGWDIVEECGDGGNALTDDELDDVPTGCMSTAVNCQVAPNA